MPFYQYSCASCEVHFKTYHGADEKADACPSCNSDNISKLLPQVTLRAEKKTTTAGQRVEKFIEESRQELQKQLEEARKEL